MPDGVTSDIAAAAILKGMTAHFLVKSVYPVQLRDTVLLEDGAGGVGLILTQWATNLGARVITTASTAHKAALSRRAGAVEVLDYPDDPQQFGAKVRELTGGNGVAAVHDGLGKSTFDASLASLAILGTVAISTRPSTGARWTRSGSTPPARCSPGRPPHFMQTRDELTWRTGELFDSIAAGTITVTVSNHYPLKDAAQAHRDLQGRKTVGSVILTP